MHSRREEQKRSDAPLALGFPYSVSFLFNMFDKPILLQ